MSERRQLRFAGKIFLEPMLERIEERCVRIGNMFKNVSRDPFGLEEMACYHFVTLVGCSPFVSPVVRWRLTMIVKKSDDKNSCSSLPHETHVSYFSVVF